MSLIGARGVAVLIDGLVLAIPVFGLAWLFSLAFPHYGFFFSESAASGSGVHARTQLGASGILLVSALSFSYFFVLEAVRGQTVGKRAMGLHTRSVSGGPAGLNAISARTILRLIDSLPAFYILGALVAMVTGRRRRRIGDWAGGTVVVRDEEVFGDLPQRNGWQIAVYPTLWVAAVLVAIFALGVGKAAGESEGALARGPVAGSTAQLQRPGTCQIAPPRVHLPTGEWTATRTIVTTNAIDACAGERQVWPWDFRRLCRAGTCQTFLFSASYYGVNVARVTRDGPDRYVAVFQPTPVPRPHRPGEDAGTNLYYSTLTLSWSPMQQMLYGLERAHQTGPCGCSPYETSSYVVRRTNPAANPPAEGP